MSEERPCVHCVIVRAINAYLIEHELAGLDPASLEANKLHAEIAADIFHVLEQHLNVGLANSPNTRREAWKLIAKLAFTQLLDLTSVQDIVAAMMDVGDAADNTKH